MAKLIKQINSLLTRSERRQAVFVLILTILMAMLEMVGIATILPFMAVLSSPEIIETNKYLNWGYNFFGFESANRYLFFLGIIVLVALLINNGVKALARWKILNFGIMTGHKISSRLFHQYLHQPYSFFLQKNSSHLAKNILSEVMNLVSNVIIPFTDTFARLVVIAAILILLMLADPLLSISAGLILGLAFGGTYLAIRKWLHAIGKERLAAQNQRYQIVNEAFSGIKNVKLTGHENTYSDFYEKPSEVFSKNTAAGGVAGEMPRYAMEVIAFGGILFIVLYLLLQREGLANALPLITLYAFAGYRLMPGMQAVFQNYTRIRFNSSVLDLIQAEMKLTALEETQNDYEEDERALSFGSEIVFKDVCFRYEQTSRPVLENINFTLPKNSSFGVIGKTGSGKTTMVDLLLGLLTPVSGEILIDGVPLTNENRRSWQKNCAYVTQHIYLCDDTIIANIAFGVSKNNIDEKKVREAAKMAALHEFIEYELEKGYDTLIGENGLRLSGGQRQRIGLARALYLDRPVLVLDEATSALDHETEKEVMDAINNLESEKTIIMIAHRLETLSKVDNVLKLNEKKRRIE